MNGLELTSFFPSHYFSYLGKLRLLRRYRNSPFGLKQKVFVSQYDRQSSYLPERTDCAWLSAHIDQRSAVGDIALIGECFFCNNFPRVWKMTEVHCQLNDIARQFLTRLLSSTELYRAPNFVGSLVRQVGRLLERDLSRQPSEISNWGILVHVKILCRHTCHMLILYPFLVRVPNSMMPSMNSWHVSDL